MAFFSNRQRYQQPDQYYRPFHHSPFVQGVPVYRVDPTLEARRPISAAPKVVRVPVHFVGSEKLDRSGSAVKIQKVFRGYLVRKSLRKIRDIKGQVDEIDERLRRSEVIDLIRKDAKERLRVNENIMSLLLKLDSISGVDIGVRGCRKAVIRKAIALQERIDSIVAADLDREENEVAMDVDGETEAGVPPVDSNDLGEVGVNSEGEAVVPAVNSNDSGEDGGNSDVVRCCEEEGKSATEVESGDEEDGIIDVGVDCEVKVSEENGGGAERKEGNDGKSYGELLEKIREENEKMMRMMSQLFERNEVQTAKMEALCRRVEMLEKAFLCERLRKKKKAKACATVVPKNH